VLDGKLRHVQEKVRLRVVEEEEGADAVVVGKTIVKMKGMASIEDHVHSDDLKKRMILVFKTVHICAISIQGEKTTSQE
jgi:hypothetical protein